MLKRFGFATNIVSHCVGALADVPIPAPLRGVIIGAFAGAIKADRAEAMQQPSEFNSCGEYFARAIRAELRPLAEAPVISPVDGTLRLVCDADAPIPQIKGITYELRELLGEEPGGFCSGSVAVLYLAPHNYHRIHAPFDAEIERVKLIPGALWPVSSWGLSHIPGLFCVNERIVIQGRCSLGRSALGRCALGRWALVMVGATNVGRMELAFCDVRQLVPREDRVFSDGVCIERGVEMGRFRLGSTVVLVTDFKLAPLEQARSVRYGEAITDLR